MFISYNWLRELTGTTLTAPELRDRLTMVGLAIDSIEEIEGDHVLDVEVPSNRPDCLSHIGIAREVAVIESLALIYPSGKPARTEGGADSLTSVEIRNPDLCSRYTARIVRGVKIAPSPTWLAKRLREIGQRPINNVADITNYVLHEMGQPLHAFDFAKLVDRRIVVRRAMSDEKLTTLDGVERRLSSEMLVIADAERPVALAGIMGGQDSEISTATTDVLIESAYFDPDSVRRTARRLGMDTEASRRFERGADCESVLRAQERCVELICEIAGGIATVDTVDVYPRPLLPVNIDFRPSRVQSLTSLQVKPAEMSRILAGLGFVQTGEREGAIMFVAPTWRVDIEREVDLVEEIARHSGYDKIASELPPSVMSGEYQPGELKLRRLRCILKCSGFDEAINFSFVETSHDEKFELIPEFSSGDGDSPVLITLQNPILEEFTRMRATLLPGLLASARHNFNQGIRDLRLFEIGRIFAGSGPGSLPRERESLALLVTGGAVEEDRAEAPRELDFYDLKGSLEAMADSLNLGLLRFDKAPIKHLKDGQAAKLSLSDGRFIGTLGTLSELVAATYKFRQPVYVAEIDLSSLLAAENKTVQYTPLPRYPSVIRDLTLLVARNVSLGQLIGFADAQGVDDYRGAKLVGTYEGPNIPEGRRSITIRVEYRSKDRTLRDEEVEVRQRQLIGSLFENFGAEVR